jgi:putative peptidoglycan binding protein
MAALLGRSSTRVIAVAGGAAVLAALIGIAHILWTRSAESEIVHYSWPVKWALTLASESPDLPAGSRFTTATVRGQKAGQRWTVTGQLELPSSEGARIVTSYSATVSSRCPSVSERRCWSMDGLSLGSVPVAKAELEPERGPLERDAQLQVATLAPLEATPLQTDRMLVQLEEEARENEDLDFILSEAPAKPVDDLISSLEEWPVIAPSAPMPSYDPGLVRDIQTGLAELGYDPGPVDGVAGPRTRAAIDAFRRQERLSTAEIGFDLLDRITERLDPEEAAPASPASIGEAYADEPSNKDWICRGINPKDRDCGE